MSMLPSFLLSQSRRKPLAACVAAMFALAAPEAIGATTWTVNTCSEANAGSGTTGSLRYAAANAISGDTVDMTGLSCSTISLKTGAITIPQNTLTLNGPGIANLTITGRYNGTTEHDRIINHTGTGTLSIYDLSVSEGYLKNPTGVASGGCIYSAGTLFLDRVGAYLCSANTVSGTASGGGVYARNALTLKYSVLSSNTAYGGSSGYAHGGGARTPGNFSAKYSTISNNIAQGASGHITGNGGGLNLGGNVTITASTISRNHSGQDQGGIDIFNISPGGVTATITNSTISGNSAAHFIGGMYVNSGTVKVRNSTIAFNTAGQGRFGSFPFAYYAPGVATGENFGPMAVTLQSSLIANNIYGTASEYDLSVPHRASTTVTFSGANNLVRATFAAVPGDTIKLSCPLLGSLRFNGGPTQTHALLSHSPGIDVGNNTAPFLTYDQRGSPYARVSGSVADIGAYEVQQGDIVFNNNFEGCPLLF